MEVRGRKGFSSAGYEVILDASESVSLLAYNWVSPGGCFSAQIEYVEKGMVIAFSY